MTIPTMRQNMIMTVFVHCDLCPKVNKFVATIALKLQQDYSATFEIYKTLPTKMSAEDV